jgi:hypothetical protein
MKQHISHALTVRTLQSSIAILVRTGTPCWRDTEAALTLIFEHWTLLDDGEIMFGASGPSEAVSVVLLTLDAHG